MSLSNNGTGYVRVGSGRPNLIRWRFKVCGHHVFEGLRISVLVAVCGDAPARLALKENTFDFHVRTACTAFFLKSVYLKCCIGAYLSSSKLQVGDSRSVQINSDALNSTCANNHIKRQVLRWCDFVHTTVDLRGHLVT